MINVVEYQDAKSFLEANESHMLEQESENNLLLGLPRNIVQSGIENPESRFYRLENDSIPVGQSIRTDAEKPLIISNMPKEAVQKLFDELSEKKLTLEGVVAPCEVAEQFSHLWSDQFDCPQETSMHQGIYELETVKMPEPNGGKMISANQAHESLALSFMTGFIQECFPKGRDGMDSAQELVARTLAKGNLYFWENDNQELVSCAAKNRESRNAANISFVFTPKEHRKNGYASRITAAVSQKMLEEGKSVCNLYTDLLNPTSNSIYQQIGYKKIGEGKCIKFELGTSTN